MPIKLTEQDLKHWNRVNATIAAVQRALTEHDKQATELNKKAQALSEELQRAVGARDFVVGALKETYELLDTDTISHDGTVLREGADVDPSK